MDFPVYEWMIIKIPLAEHMYSATFLSREEERKCLIKPYCGPSLSIIFALSNESAC